MKTMVILIRNTAGVRCRESASRRVRYGRFDCICQSPSISSVDALGMTRVKSHVISASKLGEKAYLDILNTSAQLLSPSPFIPASSFPRENPL